MDKKLAIGVGMYSVDVTRDKETELILLAGKHGFNKVLSDKYSDEQIYLVKENNFNIFSFDNSTPETLELSLKRNDYEIIDIFEWSKNKHGDIVNKLTFEIEDYNGNTIMAFQVDLSDIDNPNIAKEQFCSHADTDNDYIFNSSDSLLRIQSSSRQLTSYILKDSESDSNWSEVFHTEAPEEEIDKAIEYVKTLEDYNNDMIYNVLRAIGYEVNVTQPKEFLY
jgi:hypothetical protein